MSLNRLRNPRASSTAPIDPPVSRRVARGTASNTAWLPHTRRGRYHVPRANRSIERDDATDELPVALPFSRTLTSVGDPSAVAGSALHGGTSYETGYSM